MGIKAIYAKREELDKARKVKEAFVQAAEDLRRDLAKIEKGIRELDADRARIEKEISGLDTFGIKEFIAYKASLMAISEGTSAHFVQLTKFLTRPLPTAPLQAVIKGMEDEVRKSMNAWIEKQTATFPKEIQKLMTFKRPTGELIMVTELPNKEEQMGGKYKINVYFDNKPTKEERLLPVFLSPKYGYKYVKI
jgi:hypothetical protein